jgi:hypothetical protein
MFGCGKEKEKKKERQQSPAAQPSTSGLFPLLLPHGPRRPSSLFPFPSGSSLFPYTRVGRAAQQPASPSQLFSPRAQPPRPAFPLSFSLWQRGPTCQHSSSPLLPFSPACNGSPRNRRRAVLPGPARQGSLAALQRGSPEPRVLTLALRRPEDPQLRCPLLRRVSLSASPSGHCSGAPPTPTTPALASPHHWETSRAQHSNPEPLHHRDFVTKPPPVSHSAIPIRHRRCRSGPADSLCTSAGTSRSDSSHPEGPATPASSSSARARSLCRRSSPSSSLRCNSGHLEPLVSFPSLPWSCYTECRSI